jgi:hypothetical protein
VPIFAGIKGKHVEVPHSCEATIIRFRRDALRFGFVEVTEPDERDLRCIDCGWLKQDCECPRDDADYGGDEPWFTPEDVNDR